MVDTRSLTAVMATMMLAGIVLNFAANWSPGGGELHPDLILTSPDGPLTIDEVDAEIAATQGRLAELHRKRDWVLRAENHKLELGDHELNSWPIDFAVQAASPPNAAMGATAAAAPITEPTGTPGTLSAASTAAVMTPATAVGGAATIMAGQPRPSQHAAASQLDLGRVWRDSFKPPDADGRTERCDRGKPGSGPGTCELLYPWPDIPAVKTAAALPRFSSTCLRQFHDRSGSVMAETPAARPQLRRLSAAIGTTADQCQATCITALGCGAWTHRAPTKNPGLLDPASSTENACILYTDSGTAVLRGHANDGARCTSGLVRAGRATRTGGNLSPTPSEAAAAAAAAAGGGGGGAPDTPDWLAGMDLPEAGQCDEGTCLNIHHCAARRPRSSLGKLGFVLTDDLNRDAARRNLADSANQRRRLLAAREHGADLIFVVPEDSIARFPLSDGELMFFKEEGVVVVKVPWLIPPGMVTSEGCAKMDLIRLNAWRLYQYDAIIVVDSDVTIIGDMMPVFQCAAQNYLISTSGPLSPLNLGFFGLRPNPGILRAIEAYNATYSRETGWGKASFLPSRGPFVGAGCGQGLMWTLFYENNGRVTDPAAIAALDRAWSAAAGGTGPGRPKAFQVNRCIWNFQTEHSARCGPGFKCDDVRSVHKRIKLKRDASDGQKGAGCFYHHV